jgi:ribosome-interacting GTPase 1
MPANLPPMYFDAEKRFREAKTPESKIEALEEMLTIMPKHKGTDKLRADLRRRIAKLKEQAQQKKGGARRDAAYMIEKEGAAQIAVIGAPNTGKSALVAALTNASPEVAEFPHTTWKPTPGMAPYENIQFQLVDTPPITRDYLDPWMADLMRRADMLLVMLDLHADPLQQLEETLAVLQDLRIFPEGFPIPGELRKPPFIKKTLIVMNKVDNDNHLEDYQAFLELTEVNLPSIAISLRAGWNLNGLLELLYQLSEIIRVYTKVPGKEPNRSAPFVLAKMTTLEELAAKIHKDFVNKLKFAKIWGPKVYDGQMVQRDYVLQEGDVVEIHL